MSPSAEKQPWQWNAPVVVATMVGFLLRIWPPGRLGLNQFDEGIYSLASAWVNQPDGWFRFGPMLIPYAPPGFPLLARVWGTLVGVSGSSGLMVSIVVGTLTIPVAAGIARLLFDARAAVVTAWCVCCAGPHIAFSRMAITDATFLLCWALGIVSSCWFLRRPTIWSGLVMGLAVGVSQQVKYNGWLLGGAVILTVALGVPGALRARSYLIMLRWAGWGCLGALCAGLIVMPWFLFVEYHGGYGQLLAHQRSYLGGSGRWLPFLKAQLHQSLLLSGPLSLTLFAGAMIAWSSWMLRPRSTAARRIRWFAHLGVAALILPILAIPVISGLFMLPAMNTVRRIDHRFVAVSWVVLFFLSPFYHPYARLWLPFELIHWILLGGLSSRFYAKLETRPVSELGRRGGYLQLGCAGALLISFSVTGPGLPFNHAARFNYPGLFDPSDSLKQTAHQIQAQIPAEVSAIRTLIRPSMSFYLSGRHDLLPQSDLKQLLQENPATAWALVDSTLITSRLSGPMDVVSEREIGPLLDRWSIVRTFSAATTLPTALDLDPFQDEFRPDSSLATFWLLRPRPHHPVP